MLYNKYRRQWLAFVIVVVGRRRYRGRVVMDPGVGWFDRCVNVFLVYSIVLNYHESNPTRTHYHDPLHPGRNE